MPTLMQPILRYLQIGLRSNRIGKIVFNALNDALVVDTDEVTNESTVSGTTLTDALDNLVGIEKIEGDTIYIAEPSDFPAAVAGVRTLPGTGETYFMTKDVSLGTDVLAIAPGGIATILGPDEASYTLSTNNAAPLISGGIVLKVARISLLNASGPCIDYDGSSVGAAALIHVTLNSDSADCFANALAVIIINSSWGGGPFGGNAGVLITGFVGQILIRTIIFNVGGATETALEIAAGVTANVIDINGVSFNLSAAGQSGLDIDTSVLPVTQGRIHGCSFFAPFGTPLKAGAVDESTVGWEFDANGGIENSGTVGEVGFRKNGTVTTINTIDVWETINTGVAYTLDAESERFQLNANGRSLEYIGVQKVRVQVTMTVSVEGVSPNTAFELRLLKNSVEMLPFSADYRNVPILLPAVKLLSLETGDLLELEVRNIDDATNVTVASVQITAIRA